MTTDIGLMVLALFFVVLSLTVGVSDCTNHVFADDLVPETFTSYERSSGLREFSGDSTHTACGWVCSTSLTGSFSTLTCRKGADVVTATIDSFDYNKTSFMLSKKTCKVRITLLSR